MNPLSPASPSNPPNPPSPPSPSHPPNPRFKDSPSKNTNFAFESSEFGFSEFECFGSISHSLITVLLAWTHKKIYIDIASISSKNREAGKLNKRCLTLDEKIKILVEVKKRKLSCKAIDEEFKIGKTQAANFVKNDAKLRKELKTFKAKAINISKERLTRNLNILMTFFILRLKNVRLLAFIQTGIY